MITRIYATQQAVLDYDDSVPCVVLTHLEFLLEAEFQAVLNFGLDFMREKIKEGGRILWLPDTTLSPVFNEADSKWAVENWNPRALEAGIRHVTFVLPVDELALITVEEYKELGDNRGLTIGYFKDVESAKKWFKEQV